MIEYLLDSILVIDDTPKDVEVLIQQLKEEDVWVEHFTPDQILTRERPLRGRKLIFLDLYLGDGKLENNISLIRKIFSTSIGHNFGSYGVILWTKHPEEVDELKNRMIKDAEDYSLPLFILPLDKVKYIRDGYDSILKDIDDLLKNSIASNFFVYWNKLVDMGKNHSIKSIYSLASSSYNTLEDDLIFLLYHLAKNQTGIPVKKSLNYRLEDDSIKGIADLLHYDIIHQHQVALELFTPGKDDYKFSGNIASVFGKLNAKLFIDHKGMDQNVVIPGNVYQVMNSENIYNIDGLPDGAVPIIVEVTPPCDFSIDKKEGLSRVLSGFYIDTLTSSADKKYKGQAIYAFLDGIVVPGSDEPKIIRFDFRYSGSIKEDDLKDKEKYNLLFRFKEKLFADIIQKSSSHTSRLGIPFMKPLS